MAYWSARPRPLEQGRPSVWTFQKIADFEYLSVFQSFHSIPSFLLILRMEESKTWEAGPNLSSSLIDSSRNFRDAVMGSKKPDRAMELLRAHILSQFVIQFFYWMAGRGAMAFCLLGRPCPWCSV